MKTTKYFIKNSKGSFSVLLSNKIGISSTILLGDQKKVAAERADWTSAFQGRNTMFRSEDLPDNAWIAIVPQNLERDADDFIKTLLNVSHGMRFNMGNPRK